VQDLEPYSIEEARALLGGIARNTIYELMRTGSIPSVVIGRRRFISADSISVFIAAASTTVSPAVNGARPIRSARQMTLEFKTQLASRAQGAR
jgi:excisionase family DNA binding protein